MRIEKTKYYSWKSGELADGCKQCVKGEKLVLFVTGLCSERCDFCPVSDKKLYKDVVYANERPLQNPLEHDAIIEEAKACSAKGAGITGGDPLMVIDRTSRYIKILKKSFGKKFHIHLYTPLNLVTAQKLRKLYIAGLDEIRFHADINKPKLWDGILLARKFKWKVGVEIPIFPGREADTKKMISYLKGKIDFLNLNELELSDNAVWRRKKGIITKDKISYGIKGSESLAKKIIRHSASLGIRTHLCTCKLKDKVQLAMRVKRRAKNIKQKFDMMDPDGMLTRGAIYLPELKPGFGYRKKLQEIISQKKKKLLNKLEKIREEIISKERLCPEDLLIDEYKLRIVTSPYLAMNITKEGVSRAIVTEYPTYDALELEVEML